MKPPRKTLSALGLGRAAYYAWYAPQAELAKWLREGWINSWLSSLGRRQMEKAAPRLAPLSRQAEDVPLVYFLTGERFWYQTLFCAYSLAKQARDRVGFAIVDDGTLSSENAETLSRVLVGCKIIFREQIEEQLEQHLPKQQFPTLRARRLEYPHIKKLTDVHVGSKGWKLVLDSDMLFHRQPVFLEQWLQCPKVPLHMRDIANSYGYSDAIMRSLAGAEIPERLNVGVCGLQSDSIDWPKLEHWCRELTSREGSHYLQEQALVAMLVAGKPRSEAPASDAIVAPSRMESTFPSAALHHYVAESKAWYFRFAWRSVQAGSQHE
jgi:hypothetical protein